MYALMRADHFDTGTPHTHIVVRGRDDRDQNLVIAREYISSGMRERAAELVTLDLTSSTAPSRSKKGETVRMHSRVTSSTMLEAVDQLADEVL